MQSFRRFSPSIKGLLSFALAFAVGPISASGQSLDRSSQGRLNFQIQVSKSSIEVQNHERTFARFPKPLKVEVEPSVQDLRTLRKQLDKVQTKQLQLEGGIATGGGQVIQSGSTTGLLDFYVEAPDLFDQAQPLPGIRLPRTLAMKQFGLDVFFPRDLAIAPDMENILNQWKENSPQSFEFLRAAFSATRFIFVDQKFSHSDSQYHLPPDKIKQVASRRTVAVYLPPYGVIISKPEFESLNRLHQEGLILHEMIRHLQIVYQLGISNENLQRATVSLIRGPGHQIESLDATDLLGSMIFEMSRQKIQIHLQFMEVLQNYCNLPFSMNAQRCDHLIDLLESMLSSAHFLAQSIHPSDINPEKPKASEHLVGTLIDTYSELRKLYWATSSLRLRDQITENANQMYELITNINRNQIETRNFQYQDSLNTLSGTLTGLSDLEFALQIVNENMPLPDSEESFIKSFQSELRVRGL